MRNLAFIILVMGYLALILLGWHYRQDIAFFLLLISAG